MLILIQKKLGMSVEQASDFMRNTIGINVLKYTIDGNKED